MRAALVALVALILAGCASANMRDTVALFAACNAAGAPVTLAQCQVLVTQSDVSGDDPWTAIPRLGLMVVRTDFP